MIPLLSSFYLAPIEYYSYLYRYKKVIIEVYDNYQKQSYRNRCIIAGANGPHTLSIPIEKPKGSKCLMRDIKISDHGNWRHLHKYAIVSAYNSTPYFEYYRDYFIPFYEKRYTFLHDFNEELRELVCQLMGIDIEVEYSTEYILPKQREHTNIISREDITTSKTYSEDIIDLRETIHPKRESQFTTKPYYQVFVQRFGFIPNLSIIDLLFNMGNEALLYLE